MPITEHTSKRLVLKSGSTTLILSKDAGTATMHRKLFFWSLKPSEAPLSHIVDVTIETAVDRASGVDMCSAMLVMRAAKDGLSRAQTRRMRKLMPMPFASLSDWPLRPTGSTVAWHQG